MYSSTFEIGNSCLMFFFQHKSWKNANTKTGDHVVPQRLFIHSGKSQDPCHRFQVQILRLRSAKSVWQWQSQLCIFSPAKKKELPASSWIFWENLQQAQHKKRVRVLVSQSLQNSCLSAWNPWSPDQTWKGMEVCIGFCYLGLVL